MNRLTHLDGRGRPRMVDVADKAVSRRRATATGFIRLRQETIGLIESGRIAKGNVIAAAEFAGVQAAKKTADLIPLCHQLPLTSVRVRVRLRKDGAEVTAEAAYVGKTGVEMEALCAVNVALLTIYDMCKAVDRTMQMGGIRLVRKTKREI